MFFIGPLQVFNNYLFFKFINKYQKEILSCTPPFSHVCDIFLLCNFLNALITFVFLFCSSLSFLMLLFFSCNSLYSYLVSFVFYLLYLFFDRSSMVFTCFVFLFTLYRYWMSPRGILGRFGCQRVCYKIKNRFHKNVILICYRM